MSDVGRINGWRCDNCGEIAYCVHVDEGVTPMFLLCLAGGKLADCAGRGVSLMYPDGDPAQHIKDAVRWEWYRPSHAWARRKGPAMQEHVKQGGLCLRPLSEVGRAVLDGVKSS